MSFFYAFLGFAVLILLHEFGHFAAAKAVGMRVERFVLFFPPLAFKVRRGETEYGIGLVPLGGYCKISGMNPEEELPDDVKPRAYWAQPVWKRIVVIFAGPFVNIVLAFLIMFALFSINGTREIGSTVGEVQRGSPAAGLIEPGDRIVAVDGKRLEGEPAALARQVGSHRCEGRPRAGCRSATPARITLRRDGVERTVPIRPRYDATDGIERTRLGVGFASDTRDAGIWRASRLSLDTMWEVTETSVSNLTQLFKEEKREELSSVAGGFETTRQAFDFDTTQAFFVIALISLSLAIINLFPFLPLDGGHIFWALTEKVRGRAVSVRTMERAGIVGFALVLMVFFIGLTNDIGRFRGDGFGLE